MNVYMFDGIVYNGNSLLDFILFLFKKKKSILKYIIQWCWSFFLFIIGYYEKNQFSKKLLKCVSMFNEEEIKKEFWEKYSFKLNKWYLEKATEDDIVIHYLPAFLTDGILNSNMISNPSDLEIANMLESKEYVLYTSCKELDKISEMAKESYVYKNGELVDRNEYKASIIETFFSRAFISFVFVGVVNTLNTIIFSAVTSLFLDPNVSFILGYIFSLSVSYLLNSKITFKETLTFVKYIKFCISYIPNFIIQNVIVIIFYNGLGWNEVFVYALAGVLGIPVTFIILKLFAFKEKK